VVDSEPPPLPPLESVLPSLLELESVFPPLPPLVPPVELEVWSSSSFELFDVEVHAKKPLESAKIEQPAK
jgi:hypothetical protein